MKFDEYSFSKEIVSGIQKAGFTECTPVQEKTFNYILEGRDVYAQSQTGTGKTAAFLISIFHLLQTEEYLNGKALIVVPTRELAVQIKEEAEILGQDLNFKIDSFYGGTGYRKQEESLEQGLDIVIGTPGRLLDFSKQKKLNFSDFSILVVDEADRMFDMGFVDDLRFIFNAQKNVENKKTLLFSATMNPNVGNISWEYMNNPGEIFIEAETLTVEAITQELYHVGKDEKMSILLGLLKRENPESAIIFTNTKHMAHEISNRLDVNGYKNEYIMGDLPQKKRLSIVNSIKDGKTKFLVATDVAARGLHIDNLSLVINYDLPLDSENYVHRIGRTARAGQNGKAISLACENYVYNLSSIEDYIETKIPVEAVSDELFVEDKSAGMSFHLNDYKKRDNRNRSGNRNNNRSGNRNGKDFQKGDRRDNKPGKKRYKESDKESDKERLSRLRNSVLDVSGTNSLDGDFESKPKNKKGKPKEFNNKNGKKGQRRSSDYHKNKGNSKGHNDNIPRVSSNSKMEDRIAYYKKKYGEDFKVSSVSKGSSSKSNSSKKTRPTAPKKVETKVTKKPEVNKKSGLIGKIKGLFTR